MWCNACQQDVPAVAKAHGEKVVCARCQQELHNSPLQAGLSDAGIPLDQVPAQEADPTKPPVSLNDWQSERRARQMGRTLRRTTSGVQPASSRTRRFDPPQKVYAHLDQAATTAVTPTYATTPRRAEGGQFFAWMTVIIGSLLLCSGIGGIGWSLFGPRPELWNQALALTLSGQGMLIFGLVLVVSRLWRNSRYATGRLQDVHAQLSQLQRTADSISGERTSGAPAFYADLARGASPHVLMANLKGQIDQLATRLG